MSLGYAEMIVNDEEDLRCTTKERLDMSHERKRKRSEFDQVLWTGKDPRQ